MRTISRKKINDLREYHQITEEMKQLTERKKELKETIKGYMGDGNSIEGDCYLATNSICVRKTIDRKALVNDQGEDFVNTYLKTNVSETFKVQLA